MDHEWSYLTASINADDNAWNHYYWCNKCGMVQVSTSGKGNVYYIPGKGSKPNSQECVDE